MSKQIADFDRSSSLRCLWEKIDRCIDDVSVRRVRIMKLACIWEKTLHNMLDFVIIDRY